MEVLEEIDKAITPAQLHSVLNEKAKGWCERKRIGKLAKYARRNLRREKNEKKKN